MSQEPRKCESLQNRKGGPALAAGDAIGLPTCARRLYDRWRQWNLMLQAARPGRSPGDRAVPFCLPHSRQRGIDFSPIRDRLGCLAGSTSDHERWTVSRGIPVRTGPGQ